LATPASSAYALKFRQSKLYHNEISKIHYLISLDKTGITIFLDLAG